MKTLSLEQVKEIAEELECGNRCYFHKQTGELLFIPDMEDDPFAEEDFFAEELAKLENESDNYIEIERPSSHDSFIIMADFADQLADSNDLKNILTTALSKKKPFQEFKFQIDNSGIYRNEWFEFKSARFQQ